MKTILKLAAMLSLLSLLNGCMMSAGGIAKVIKEGGLAKKKIKMEFSGWNANLKYESEPVYENAPATTSNGALTIYPVTRLESVRAGEVVVGAPGPAGPAGQAGQTGDTGETGATGSKGAAGPAGIKGTPGPTGPAGEQGVQGPAGPAPTAPSKQKQKQ